MPDVRKSREWTLTDRIIGGAVGLVALPWLLGWGFNVAGADPDRDLAYWFWPSYVAVAILAASTVFVLFTWKARKPGMLPEPESAFGRGDFPNSIFEGNVTDADTFLYGSAKNSYFLKNRQKRN